MFYNNMHWKLYLFFLLFFHFTRAGLGFVRNNLLFLVGFGAFIDYFERSPGVPCGALKILIMWKNS